MEIELDRSEAQSFLTYHESIDRSYFDRLNELDALVSEQGSSSFKEAIDDISAHSDIANIWGSIESYYTGMKVLTTTIPTLIVLALIIWILYKCGFCKCKRRKRSQQIKRYEERDANSMYT